MFAFAEGVTLFECQACYQLSPCVANRQQHLENLEQYRVVKSNIQDICYPPIATMTPAYAFPMTLILPPSGGPYGYTFTSMAYYHRDPKWFGSARILCVEPCIYGRCIHLLAQGNYKAISPAAQFKDNDHSSAPRGGRNTHEFMLAGYGGPGASKYNANVCSSLI